MILIGRVEVNKQVDLFWYLDDARNCYELWTAIACNYRLYI